MKCGGIMQTLPTRVKYPPTDVRGFKPMGQCMHDGSQTTDVRSFVTNAHTEVGHNPPISGICLHSHSNVQECSPTGSNRGALGY